MILFLSYAHADRFAAAGVKSDLEQRGFTCFMAHETIKPTQEWRERIWDELHACTGFVALISGTSNKSAWCQQEIAIALDRGIPFVFARIDEATPDGFASKYQACRLPDLIPHIEQDDKFVGPRIEAAIQRTAASSSFAESNELAPIINNLERSMTIEQAQRWVQAAEANPQAQGAFQIGPIIRRIRTRIESISNKPVSLENETTPFNQSRERSRLISPTTIDILANACEEFTDATVHNFFTGEGIEHDRFADVWADGDRERIAREYISTLDLSDPDDVAKLERVVNRILRYPCLTNVPDHRVLLHEALGQDVVNRTRSNSH